MRKTITLQEFIMDTQAEFPFVSGQLTRLLTDIGVAAKIVNHQVNRAGLAGILGDAGSENTHNEAQQKLDVFADRTFMRILTAGKSVAGIGSEEQEDYILCGDQGKSGKYVVMIDPLDGSSNADVNVSIGTIFSIFRRVTPMGESLSDQDFLQRGTEQVVAGYILYGSSTMLVYTTGSGVNGFTLDPAVGEFFLSHAKMQFPETGSIYSINDALLSEANQATKSFIAGCRETPEVGFKSRYIGSLVSDFHRNLIKGGIYLYPSTKSHPHGKLRLCYECAPLAFLALEAGGAAEDDLGSILEKLPETLHERSPFYVGSVHLIQGLRSCWMENQ
ncbi:class 1 fructose-bisphosphatase [Flavobacteriales bacterium]|jgi:fructose-1,6-bisphosphatase I|nr:class 1 fructose-bisphosphatase [Flavobacteriales bacterium]